MDIPSGFAEDGEEGVDGNEADSVFNEAPCEEAGLSEAVHPVAFANGLRFLHEIESGASLFAGHHPESGVEVVVHEASVLAGFKRFDGLIDDVAQALASFNAKGGELVWGEQVWDFEVGFGRIGHQGERVVGFAEEAACLTIREVATAAAHEFWEDDERGKVCLPSAQVAENGACMGALDAAGEAAPGLHDLPTGVVNGGAVVVAGANERELVGDGGVFGERF